MLGLMPPPKEPSKSDGAVGIIEQQYTDDLGVTWKCSDGGTLIMEFYGVPFKAADEKFWRPCRLVNETLPVLIEEAAIRKYKK